MSLTQIFDQAIERKASDIHLATGEVPTVRIAGELVRLDLPPMDVSAMVGLLEGSIPPDGRSRIDVGLPVEWTVVHRELAFVGVAFRCGSEGMAITFRVLPGEIPDLDVIAEGAKTFFENLADAKKGLVLISGPTGSGKWTTACSLVNRINSKRAARIFVVEMHPSYRFTSLKGLVTQLHIGQDLDSYTRALEIALQADLDVLAIDDIPTVETLRGLLILAETGHLVIANIHSDGVTDAVQRLLSHAGNDHDSLQKSLAKNVIAVTGQLLFSRSSGKGRVPAYEWLQFTPAVQSALTTGDTRLGDLQNAESESRSWNQALDSLVEDGQITGPTADSARVR